MKPAYRRDASCITPVCRMQRAAACCMMLVCRLLQSACRMLQPAYARMQAAVGITRMHTLAFLKMHLVGKMMYSTAYVMDVENVVISSPCPIHIQY